MNELNTAWTAASEEMYKATQEAGAQQPADEANQNGTAGSENVTDAEFEEVKQSIIYLCINGLPLGGPFVFQIRHYNNLKNK